MAREDKTAKRLLTIPGVGEQIATGVVASVPDPRLFKNSRQFAAWLGLVPRQYTTGNKIRLGRITKRGDKYLRMCLVHGARAVVANLGDKQDHVSCWVRDLIERRGYLRAVVALAARNARLIWTLMMKRENYRAICRCLIQNSFTKRGTRRVCEDVKMTNRSDRGNESLLMRGI